MSDHPRRAVVVMQVTLVMPLNDGVIYVAEGDTVDIEMIRSREDGSKRELPSYPKGQIDKLYIEWREERDL